MSHWAGLPANLLCRVDDSLDDLKCNASVRGTCTAWHHALASLSPSLVIVLDGAGSRPVATSLSMRRSFDLQPIPSGTRCVGSGNGWLTLALPCYHHGGLSVPSLFNPVTATEVCLPSLIYDGKGVSKLVITFSPGRHDFVAVAICDADRLVRVAAGDMEWTFLNPVQLEDKDHLVDLVYNEDGRVCCLTRCGDVHVLLLPERRHSRAGVDPSTPPATVENLLSSANLPFDSATSFAPPYNTVSGYISAKHLVFCEGNLYQIWRNASCTVTLPAGGRLRVVENEIFILRYYPWRQPCWDVITDLGGYSMFIGRNNAVSMYAEGVPGLKGNCVYWIDGRGSERGMVFDMTTRM